MHDELFAGGETFAYFDTTVGGACTVWIDPHESTNGSAVTGWFVCTDLAASNGKVVAVQGGRFGTFISDTANDPRQTPPTPGASFEEGDSPT